MTRPSAGFVGALAGIAAFALLVIVAVLLKPKPPPPPPAQAIAAAPPQAVPRPAPRPAKLPDAPPGVVVKAIRGASIDVMVRSFQKIDVTLERAPDAKGVPRLFGQHPDNLTIVELSGHGDALEAGSVLVGLPAGQPQVLERNTAALLILLSGTGWTEGYKWVLDAMGKGAGKQTHGGVAYEVATFTGLEGAFLLSVTPAKPQRAAAISDEQAMAQAFARAQAMAARGSSGGAAPTALPPPAEALQAEQHVEKVRPAPEKMILGESPLLTK